jgi:hypothetical protein
MILSANPSELLGFYSFNNQQLRTFEWFFKPVNLAPAASKTICYCITLKPADQTNHAGAETKTQNREKH